MTTKCPKCKAENPDTQSFCGNCGTKLTPVKEIPLPTQTLEAPREELTTGSTFAGRYQIIEELGRGGMGRVYKATDTKINEKVALKLIKPEIASDKKTLERFGNELRIARKITHKNVGKMFDINEEKGTHYITMEYVSGQDLKGFIRQSGQMGVGTSISVTKQICEGLEEAHRLGVVHRDLKPSNIMIDKEGNARIMDFGIARSLKEKGITGVGVMIGTPEYMSPEQVEGKEVDQRSDIYSLGVILYEMVTGRVPFEGDTPFTIGMKHKGETPKNPKELNTQISNDLNHLILRCLEKDKDKRYQSAEEVRSELTNIEKGFPTTERVVPKKKPLTSKEITVTFGLKRLFIPALIIIALTIFAVVIWKPWLQKEAILTLRSKPSIAVLLFEDLSPQKDQGYFCEGLADSIINALIKIKDLRVPARGSSFSFKGTDKKYTEIAEKLDVTTVLDGSVQKEGNTIRVTAQLINTDDEAILWSDQFNRDIEDVFTIQDQISLAIVDKLKINILREEKENLVKRDTKNIEAYKLYLQGRFFWNKRTGNDAIKALEYFEKAIKMDSEYALAYAGLADCYIILPMYAWWAPNEAFQRARNAAINALKFDNQLAEAHTSLAFVMGSYDWDWSGAEREFKEAIKINPGYANSHHWYGLLLAALGRIDEAIAELKKACELDPLSLIINTNCGDILYHARRYDEAIGQYRKTLEIDQNFLGAHQGLGKAYIQKSMFKEAVKEFVLESPVPFYRVIYAYISLGKKEEAFALLEKFEEMSTQQYVRPIILFEAYLSVDNIDKAFELLDKLYQERSPDILDKVLVDPFYDRIRSDPRYKDFLKKIDLFE